MAQHFQVKIDRYNSVTLILCEQTFTSDGEFIQNLKDGMSQWKAEGKKGLWVKVDCSLSRLIPHLLEMGLDFHHAQSGYVMLSIWLPDDEPNNLPHYANHYIGVAGFVVNKQNQVLVIQEKYHDHTSPWKLPGGHADKEEDLADTAKREVLEETGVECEFVSLIAFRHMHNYWFGCSDIYFVCLMRPLHENIKACPKEIAACQWMDLDEYINQPIITPANRHFAQCYKDGLSQNKAIVPIIVQSHNIYSIQTIGPAREEETSF